MRNHSSVRGFTFVSMLGAIGLTSLAMSLYLPDVSVEHLTPEGADPSLTVHFFNVEYEGGDLDELREELSKSLLDTPFDVCMLYVETEDPSSLRIGLWTPVSVPLERGVDALRLALGTHDVIPDETTFR